MIDHLTPILLSRPHLTTPKHAHTSSPKPAGRVNINECHSLSDTLQMVAGGPTFMPGACTAMLTKEQGDLSSKFEAENAQVGLVYHGAFSFPYLIDRPIHSMPPHPVPSGVPPPRAPQLVGGEG